MVAAVVGTLALAAAAAALWLLLQRPEADALQSSLIFGAVIGGTVGGALQYMRAYLTRLPIAWRVVLSWAVAGAVAMLFRTEMLVAPTHPLVQLLWPAAPVVLAIPGVRLVADAVLGPLPPEEAAWVRDDETGEGTGEAPAFRELSTSPVPPVLPPHASTRPREPERLAERPTERPPVRTSGGGSVRLVRDDEERPRAV